MRSVARRSIPVLVIVMAIGFGWMVLGRFPVSDGPAGKKKGAHAVPVEVAPVERGHIALRRTFSGTLEAAAKFVVAPKVAGRIEKLTVDLSDAVARGQMVAELDNAEYVQAVSQAEADLAVARAHFSEAESALEIATRELSRIRTLLKRGVASEAQFDSAHAEELGKRARLEVAKAQVARAEAAVETARIRLGYTRVGADWSGGDADRVVAERFVDEGQTVSANTPLLEIVELDPVLGVIFVTEKDYSRLQPGQTVHLTTDAWPGTAFEGNITRISPVFRQATRQARVELTIENPDHRLKPGMFIRATVTLQRVDDAVIVPESAIARRNDTTGVFVVSADGKTVSWRKAAIGIRDGDRVQVMAADLTGRVVTLGQQLVDDGSAILIPDETTRTASGTGSGEADAR